MSLLYRLSSQRESFDKSCENHTDRRYNEAPGKTIHIVSFPSMPNEGWIKRRRKSREGGNQENAIYHQVQIYAGIELVKLSFALGFSNLIIEKLVREGIQILRLVPTSFYRYVH